MKTTAERESLWLADSRDLVEYPPLRGEVTADVAVVGGGITGLTTALLLQREGLRVAVLEADRVGSATTGNNTAKISALQATVYSGLIDRHGVDVATTYAQANSTGVEAVAEIVQRLGIDCDLRRRPAFTYAISEAERRSVEAEFEAAGKAGLTVVYDRDGGPDLPFPIYGSIRLDAQLAFHPLRYVRALAAAVNQDGSHIFEHSRVVDVHAGSGSQVRTEAGTVTADRVVIATHAPLLDRGGYFARLEAMRSYCVAARLRAGTPPVGLSISAGDPAWSIASSGEFLIVGGQGHPAGERGVDSGKYVALEAFARERWDVAEITHRWSAQDLVAYDQLPMIGPYTPGSRTVYVATGFRKWGLAMATAAGMLLSDTVAGKSNPWATVFNPHRLSLRSAPQLVGLNAKAALHFIGDRLRPAEVSSPAEIPRGEARVLRDGHARAGVYRDDDGVLHAVSLRCTHLGCLLRFNGAESSWDCPCHGSRFDVDGAVLEGPASNPLARKEITDS